MRGWRSRGYTCFYLKVGVDATAETTMLAAIRETIEASARSASTRTRPGRCRRQ
jgi:hypothetical protein